MLLGGAKDDLFSCFLSSCQLGLSHMSATSKNLKQNLPDTTGPILLNMTIKKHVSSGNE